MVSLAMALATFYALGTVLTGAALAGVWASEPEAMTWTQYTSACLAWPVTWHTVVAVIMDEGE